MGARFEVDVEGGRLVRWASGGVAWSLRGHRVDGQPRVALTRAGEALGVVAVGELWDLVDAVGVLFDGAVTGSTERARDPDRRPAGPPSAGEPWTDELDRDLTARWEAGERIKELARRFGRTQGAITSRVTRLGLVTDRQAARTEDRRRGEAEEGGDGA